MLTINDLSARIAGRLLIDHASLSLADGAKVGAAAVFSAKLGGERLTFSTARRPGRFRDNETGSLWDVSGRAAAGPLAGRRLRPRRHDDQFWFALAAFYPNAKIRR